MMGMHGEAWVNDAIQDADLLIALGMRFDDRVTGTAGVCMRRGRRRSTSTSTRPRLHKNVRADVGDRGRPPRRCCSALAATGAAGPPRRLAGPASASFAGGPTVRDLTGIDDAGPLQAAQVIHDIWRATEGRGHRRHRRRPAPDVGGAVLPRVRAEHLDHLGRPRHDGLRPAGGDRRQAGAARPRGVGHRRRRRLPDDPGGAGDAGAGRA